MEYPKFILTDTGRLRLGMVRLHKHLLHAGEHCIGGGYYEFDYVGNRLLLSGSSYDFGTPQWLKADVLKVPAEYRGMEIVYMSGNAWENRFVVSEALTIDYV